MGSEPKFSGFKFPKLDENDILSDSTVSEAKDGLVAAQEAYILSFFGSKENVQKYGDDYILEETPGQVETSCDWVDSSVSIRFTKTIRLRPKTDEEKAATNGTTQLP